MTLLYQAAADACLRVDVLRWLADERDPDLDPVTAQDLADDPEYVLELLDCARGDRARLLERDFAETPESDAVGDLIRALRATVGTCE